MFLSVSILFFLASARRFFCSALSFASLVVGNTVLDVGLHHRNGRS